MSHVVLPQICLKCLKDKPEKGPQGGHSHRDSMMLLKRNITGMGHLWDIWDMNFIMIEKGQNGDNRDI
jgi:hypothetical protein